MKVRSGPSVGTRASFWRRRVWLGLLPCAGVMASCVTSPKPEAIVEDNAQQIVFEGLLPPAYGSTVTVQALTPTLTWTNLGSTQATASGTWARSVVVPPSSWFLPCGSALVRAISDQNQPLTVSDAACLAALPSDASPEEQQACSKPSLVLNQPLVHEGDLSLFGSDEAEPYKCVTKIVGDLSVNNGTDESVALPKLHEVTGNLEVTLNRYIEFEPRVEFVTGRFEAPILSTIGGDVALHDNKDPQIPGSDQAKFDFSLDAVTSVGGDVWIDNSAFPGNIKALNALTSVVGNLEVNWSSNDVNADVLLSSLEVVHGGLDVTVSTNANRLLGALRRVQQDLSIQSYNAAPWHAAPTFLDALERVDGDMTLYRWEKGGCSAMSQLDYVGGTLRLEQLASADTARLGTSLSTGALEVVAGSAVTLLPAADLEVRDAGDVTITDNPNLCQCTVAAFLDQLQTNGWTGSASVSGNGALASCRPCPAPACR